MSESVNDTLRHIALNHDDLAKDYADDACYHRGVAEGIRRALAIVTDDAQSAGSSCPDCGAGYDGQGCDFFCPSRGHDDIRDLIPDMPMTPTDLLIPSEEVPPEFHSPHPETGGQA